MILLRDTVQVCGVLGKPVAHSLSPAMQNAAFKALGIPWEYQTFLAETTPAAELLFEEVRAGVFAGLNVTLPYKQLAFSMCDAVSPTAVVVRGVNTLRLRDGELYGESTDGAGIVRALESEGRLTIAGARVCILGTGATATAAAWALGLAGAAQITLVSRDVRRASVLARELGEQLERYEGAEMESFEPACYEALDYQSPPQTFARFDAIVNATPLGMKPQDPSPLSAQCFTSNHVVCDVVYGTTHESEFLRLAREADACAFDGRAMLVEQGALSLSIWTGLDEALIPRKIMREAVDRELARRILCSWR